MAHRKARRGKRDRPEVTAFEYDLEANLVRIQTELMEQSYHPGPYRIFTIREPKVRLISAAPYRDRVVHHALMNVLAPILDARMDSDSYACREGKGTHAALDRYTYFARRFPYVWHGDIRKFFPSIDHAILKQLLRGIIKDAKSLWLLEAIIDASNPQEDVQAWFPGDDLLAPAAHRRGLPIGNLTSQWLANLYLAPLDRFAKQTLRASGYVRYCDDFCLFADSPSAAKKWIAETSMFLGQRLRLELNAKHLRPVAVRHGLTFLGVRAFPDHRLVASVALARSVRKLKLRRDHEGVAVNPSGRLHVAEPWIAHVSHADTWRLRGSVLTRLARGSRQPTIRANTRAIFLAK